MPAIANITVKKNDGTTDVTYTGLVPSSGDKNPALWRNQSQGSASAHRPQFTLQSQSNGPKTARRLRSVYEYPVTAVGSDGKTYIVDKAIKEVTWVVPVTMPDTDVNEFVSQSANLDVSTLVKDSVKAGFAPT
jgi:hypothetical protein